MSTLQIRHLPEDVFQALAFRADKEHRSLAQQAIVELRKLPEVEARGRRLLRPPHFGRAVEYFNLNPVAPPKTQAQIRGILSDRD